MSPAPRPPGPASVEVYHGTSAKIGSQILESGSFKKADYSGSWLGTGVYFWEGDRDRAVLFAHNRHGKQYMVLKTQLSLGSCLDLTQSRFAPLVRSAYRQLKQRSATKGDRLARNVGRRHFLDCQVINHLCETMGHFDTVRCAFRDGDRIYAGAELFGLSQVMIAVRNTDMILGPTEFVAQGV